MASRGKNGSKKSLNNSQTSCNNRNKTIIAIIAIICFFVILYMIIFPNSTVNITVKILVAVVVCLVSVAGTIIGIVSKMKKKTLIKHAIPIAVVAGVFAVVSVAQVVANVVETDIEEPIEPPKINENVDKKEENIFSFNISFDDALFSDYSPSELSENRNVLIEQIVQSLKSKLTDPPVYSDELRQQYDKCVLEAHDFEKAYKLFHDNGVFGNHHQNNRIMLLDGAIELRENGDEKLEMYDNQECIATLHNDKGYELCRVSKYKEAIIVYETAVKWSLKALNLLYNTHSASDYSKEKILNNVIRSYTGITESTTDDNGDYKKSKILIEIYEEIRDCDLI